MRILKRTLLVPLLVALTLDMPSMAAAQRPVPRPVPTAPVETGIDSLTPPISPRRAFVYSFFVPGSSQTILGRHKAGATFILLEAVALGMIRESAADVHEARRLAADSVVLSYVDATGAAIVTKGPSRFNDNYIHTRQAHVEDWIALLVANHLFAGADAFVAAHLWDIPARLAIRVRPGSGTMSASLEW